MTPSGVRYDWRKPSRRRPSATAPQIRGDVPADQPSFSHVHAPPVDTRQPPAPATRGRERVHRNRRAVCECYNGPMGLSPSTHTNRETPSGHASEAAAGASVAAPPILRPTFPLYRLFDLSPAPDVAPPPAGPTPAPAPPPPPVSPARNTHPSH